MPPRDEMKVNAETALLGVRIFEQVLPTKKFNEMIAVFPPEHFVELLNKRFSFYRNTFWYPLDREPDNIFEKVLGRLKEFAAPSERVTGIEWWFSVLITNRSPQWILPCHFDRDDLSETNISKEIHPEFASVLFLNRVPYGELVVTDQKLTTEGIRPSQPQDMQFIAPRPNLYAVFPGNLYHGVIGRMWRAQEDTKLRVTMAVNYWHEKPKASSLQDSRGCLTTFGLRNG